MSSLLSQETPETYSILVLDPDIQAGEQTANVITETGHQAVLTHTAESALHRLLTHPFALLFTEVFFPAQNGFEVCKNIWNHIQANQLNIAMMALTQTTNPEHIRLCFKSGCMNVIMKPLNNVKLEAALSLYRFKQTQKAASPSAKREGLVSKIGRTI